LSGSSSPSTLKHEALGELQVARLERMFRNHAPAVRALCSARLRHLPDVEDAVQETFHRAAQNRRAVPEGELGPWLSRIAINVCNDEFRRRRRIVISEPDGTTQDPTPEANPESSVLSRLAVEQLLDHLTPAERRVVTRKWLLGQSHVHTGSELQIRDSTARALLTRARKRLIAYLRAETVTPG
jgi:RNA polymerase sigma-70 factor (ECF subfamily)